MKAINKCVNCGSLPEIIKSDDPEYKLLLRHKISNLCYPSYKLDSYQMTKAKCISTWNEFNAPVN